MVKCSIIHTDVVPSQSIAVKPGFVSHEPIYLIPSREVRTNEPLQHSQAAISCSAVKSRR